MPTCNVADGCELPALIQRTRTCAGCSDVAQEHRAVEAEATARYTAALERHADALEQIDRAAYIDDYAERAVVLFAATSQRDAATAEVCDHGQRAIRAGVTAEVYEAEHTHSELACFRHDWRPVAEQVAQAEFDAHADNVDGAVA